MMLQIFGKILILCLENDILSFTIHKVIFRSIQQPQIVSISITRVQRTLNFKCSCRGASANLACAREYTEFAFALQYISS